MMSGRRTRGRQRIPIRRIENQDDLYATFSKRRLGIYKKASELSTLCGVDVGVIVFSPTDNPFSFFHPSMESVVERYRNPNQQLNPFDRVVEAHTRARIEQLNRRLDEVQELKEEIKKRERYLDEINRSRPKGWWEQVPIESLNKEQVTEWMAWFQNFHSQVTNRIEELKNGGSSSLAFQQPQNVPNFLDAPPAYTSVGPGNFAQSYVPPGASYAPTSGAVGADQFQGQYYVPPVAQYLPGGSGGTTGHLPIQYYVPPQAQNPSLPGASMDQFPIQFDYFPPQVQNPSIGGGSGEAGPSHHKDNNP